MTRHNVRHRFPWRRRALRALRVLAPGRTYRALARELRARGLVDELVDPATVRRAVLRVGARS